MENNNFTLNQKFTEALIECKYTTAATKLFDKIKRITKNSSPDEKIFDGSKAGKSLIVRIYANIPEGKIISKTHIALLNLIKKHGDTTSKEIYTKITKIPEKKILDKNVITKKLIFIPYVSDEVSFNDSETLDNIMNFIPFLSEKKFLSTKHHFAIRNLMSFMKKKDGSESINLMLKKILTLDKKYFKFPHLKKETKDLSAIRLELIKILVDLNAVSSSEEKIILTKYLKKKIIKIKNSIMELKHPLNAIDISKGFSLILDIAEKANIGIEDLFTENIEITFNQLSDLMESGLNNFSSFNSYNKEFLKFKKNKEKILISLMNKNCLNEFNL